MTRWAKRPVQNHHEQGQYSISIFVFVFPNRESFIKADGVHSILGKNDENYCHFKALKASVLYEVYCKRNQYAVYGNERVSLKDVVNTFEFCFIIFEIFYLLVVITKQIHFLFYDFYQLSKRKAL